ncbi:BACON domain-containing protein [Alistipes sp.]|uniref:BACON domain-containing protein n=1 Tax=Alistipes sp. TaxID=1872444 RepID=UPI003A8BBC44
MKKIVLAIVCMASCLWSCSDDEAGNLQPTDSIQLSKDLIETGFEGGTDEIVVTSSGDWRMSGTSTWVHPSATEGKPGDTILFTIDPNATDHNLQAEFKLFTGSAVARLTVTCGEGYVLMLDSDAKIALTRNGGEFTVRLNTNIPAEELTCTFSEGGDTWISSEKSTDVFGDLVMSFSMAENTAYSDRSSLLTISGHDLSAQVTVTQAALDYLHVECQEVYQFNDMSAATFTVEVESNVDYTVTVPDWITYQKVETRALTTEVLQFNVSEGTSTRLSDVVIADAKKQYEFSFSVRQIAPGAQIISIPDAAFRNRLGKNNWIVILDENSDEVILKDLESIKEVDRWYYDILQVSNEGIKSLEGIEYFTWVTICNLGGNPDLEVVDISSLTSVTTVNVDNNTRCGTIICGENACTVVQSQRMDIPKITVTGNKVKEINLTAYYISGDQLQELDVTGCPNLTKINGYGRNNLQTIYITAEQQSRVDAGTLRLESSSASFVVK